ncbi:TIGR02597 family protein [Sulfuriroseicoccus oceanibius]|uniref:TIGR02597 family protein n=1 Tax=Sulfuriroseicoccus oceanibius TaxID=2707525 RepID=A0A6B3L894_9BACT|nr:TIGR02597 family protein [Sulfuriroseicoccus oceanibius]QQL44350.1 TIGR02597 family protein [Sulfuriroseicoccus oceanibius]
MKAYFLSTALVAAGIATLIPDASAATTDPVGYNTVECLPNSDTIVGVPLRQSGSVVGTVDSIGTPAADAVTITLTSAPSTTDDAFAFSHYLQFTSGTLSGQYFTIGANSGTTVTIDLNGGDVSTVAQNDTVRIVKYWTLEELFPAAQATTAFGEAPDYEPNGHAIFASSSTSPRGRMTQLFLLGSDLGVNKSASQIFYIANGQWQTATGSPTTGDTILLPDSYFVIRHPAAVTQSTKFTCTGEVELGTFSIPLVTSSSSTNDIVVALPRPVDVKLSELNLFESGAFTASAGTSPRGRKDLLIVFDNSTAGLNKTGRIFYHDGTNWLEATNSNAISNDFVISAGTGFVIRKVASTDGSVEWLNTPSY